MGGADTAQAFSALVPGAQLEVMPRAGHAPWIDDPDHAASVTAAFLRPEPEPARTV
jgi:pimeloyl-ACP methyl ester carboxylesterase